jgi:hypothetical protein
MPSKTKAQRNKWKQTKTETNIFLLRNKFSFLSRVDGIVSYPCVGALWLASATAQQVEVHDMTFIFVFNAIIVQPSGAHALRSLSENSMRSLDKLALIDSLEHSLTLSLRSCTRSHNVHTRPIQTSAAHPVHQEYSAHQPSFRKFTWVDLSIVAKQLSL